jgi:hypothetical protein
MKLMNSRMVGASAGGKFKIDKDKSDKRWAKISEILKMAMAIKDELVKVIK